MYGRWLTTNVGVAVARGHKKEITNGKIVKMNGAGRPFVGHIAHIYAI